jgi:VCBS repeat-containing protein
LKELLRSADQLKRSLTVNTQSDEYSNGIGIQITDINNPAIVPTKDTSRALEVDSKARRRKPSGSES